MLVRNPDPGALALVPEDLDPAERRALALLALAPAVAVEGCWRHYGSGTRLDDRVLARLLGMRLAETDELGAHLWMGLSPAGTAMAARLRKRVASWEKANRDCACPGNSVRIVAIACPVHSPSAIPLRPRSPPPEPRAGAPLPVADLDGEG